MPTGNMGDGYYVTEDLQSFFDPGLAEPMFSPLDLIGGTGILLKVGSKVSVDRIGSITVRQQRHSSRWGDKAGDPAVEIKYRNGTSVDMTRVRVKEKEINPYVDGGYRNVKFENALDRQGIKRAPTPKELEWFNSIDW